MTFLNNSSPAVKPRPTAISYAMESVPAYNALSYSDPAFVGLTDTYDAYLVAAAQVLTEKGLNVSAVITADGQAAIIRDGDSFTAYGNGQIARQIPPTKQLSPSFAITSDRSVQRIRAIFTSVGEPAVRLTLLGNINTEAPPTPAFWTRHNGTVEIV